MHLSVDALLATFGANNAEIATAAAACGVGRDVTRHSLRKWRERGAISAKGIVGLACMARQAARTLDLTAFLVAGDYDERDGTVRDPRQLPLEGLA